MRQALNQATPDGLDAMLKDLVSGKRSSAESRKQNEIKRRSVPKHVMGVLNSQLHYR